VVHSNSLFHRLSWFTLRSVSSRSWFTQSFKQCFIGAYGSLKTFVSSRSVVHSIILFHPPEWFTFPRCLIQWCGSLPFNVSSVALVHLSLLFHILFWFTPLCCFIFANGSLWLNVSFSLMVHSSVLSHLGRWFSSFLTMPSSPNWVVSNNDQRDGPGTRTHKGCPLVSYIPPQT